VPSLRKWSRYRLPPSASLGHDEFLKNFQLPINFTAVQVGDFIDQNLNQGQAVSSLLIDHLIMSIETKKQFEDIGYYLWRFRHSAFGYKLRDWTKNLLAMRALELNAYDALVEILNDSDKFGYYPDVMTLNCIILHLIETGRHEDCLKVTKIACLKDMANSLGFAKLAAAVIARNHEIIEANVEEKEFYAVIRNLGTQFEELNFLTSYANRGIANLISQDQITKSDYFFINPHLDYASMTKIKEDLTYAEIIDAVCEKINLNIPYLTEDLKNDIESAKSLRQDWMSESSKLHEAFSALISDRKAWSDQYILLEERHKAGIDYALTQSGLWNEKAIMEKLGTDRMPKIVPPYLEQKHKLVAVSDLELEQDVYEKESPEEWQKIKTFFGNRVEEKLKVRNNQKVPMRKGYLKNPRWKYGLTAELAPPSSVPKLPVD